MYQWEYNLNLFKFSLSVFQTLIEYHKLIKTKPIDFYRLDTNGDNAVSAVKPATTWYNPFKDTRLITIEL